MIHLVVVYDGNLYIAHSFTPILTNSEMNSKKNKKITDEV